MNTTGRPPAETRELPKSDRQLLWPAADPYGGRGSVVAGWTGISQRLDRWMLPAIGRNGFPARRGGLNIAAAAVALATRCVAETTKNRH